MSMFERPRPALCIALAAAALLALLALGSELRNRQDAAQLARKVRAALDQPLQRAPEFHLLPAARTLGELQAALEHYDSPELRGLLAWAKALDEAQKDRPDAAEAALESARALLTEAPDQAPLELLAGILALHRGDAETAERHAQAALAADPKAERARVLLADAALDLGRPAEALAQLAALPEALVLDQPGLVNRKGLAHEALGQILLAEECYRRATERDSGFAQGHVNLGRLLRQAGAHAQAEEAFDRGIRADARSTGGYLGRGLSRIAQGDLVGGAHDLEQARALSPAQSEPLLALADLDAARGDHATAIDRYRAALLITPEHAVGWLKLGNALMRSGRSGAQHEAAQAYERALAGDPQLAPAHNGLGAARMALGDHQGALAALTRAQTLDEHDPSPARNLALLRERMR